MTALARRINPESRTVARQCRAERESATEREQSRSAAPPHRDFSALADPSEDRRFISEIEIEVYADDLRGGEQIACLFTTPTPSARALFLNPGSSLVSFQFYMISRKIANQDGPGQIPVGTPPDFAAALHRGNSGQTQRDWMRESDNWSGQIVRESKMSANGLRRGAWLESELVAISSIRLKIKASAEMSRRRRRRRSRLLR
ncbi:hypothetical protein BKA70DRAFT_1218016 [Coprinopsis sp. MPI-PUGE-AT-0042]|nr:hypothetical protein BKA70DRAFT_1218016 [Coprinopsis sp. MPI-PUGE-AT-0042]